LPFASVLAEDAAIISGYTISEETPPEIPFDEGEMAAMEGVTDIGLSMALHHLGIDPGTSEYNDITSAVDEFWDALEPQEAEIEYETFAVMYLPCMMYMVTPTHGMAIRLPPGESVAQMEAWDKTTHEAFSMDLNRKLSATSGVTGSGWSSGVNMTAQEGTDTLIGYDVQEYSFEYEGGMGASAGASNNGQGGILGGMGASVSVTNDGTAWVSEEVTGMDIIKSFYENFGNEIAAEQGETSFYGGMMKNLVGLLQHGLPLHTIQTTTSKVGSRTMSSGTTETWVTNATVISRNTQMCAVSTIPEGYNITQMGAPEEGCDCSCAAFERMQKMGSNRNRNGDPTPEETAMAMCMMECGSQFMSCAMNMNR